MPFLKNILHSTSSLFFPHLCVGCGSDLVEKEEMLCLKCLHDLPHTGFENITPNLIEKIFYGRVPVQSAHSEFYFTKGKLIQHLIHQLKYKNNTAIGEFLGRQMGNALLRSGRFEGIDCLIPLPLHADKQFKRGYNQAEIICRGIEQATHIPVLPSVVIRQKYTGSQTNKHRTERWENVDSSFTVIEESLLQNKYVLLVDDVITTGATLEACAAVLARISGLQLSVATLAIAGK